MTEINLQNATSVLSYDTAVVEFFGTRCHPCRSFKHIVESVMSEFNIPFFCCDTGKYPHFANEFNISSLPTVIVLRRGKIVAHLSGVCTEENFRKFVLKNTNGENA